MQNILRLIILITITSFQGFSQSMPQIFGKTLPKFVGSEMIAITFTTSPETIKRLMPEPLLSDSTNMVTIVIALQKVPEIMNYNEIFISINASYKGKSGGYLPLLYLDRAAPIVAGREIAGFPKVDGEFEIVKLDNKVSAVLKRNGETLLEFSASLQEKNAMINEKAKSIGFVIKEIPSADGSPIPALKRLNTFTSRNSKSYDYQVCENVNLKLYASEKNFMPEIPIIDIIRVVSFKSDYTLDYGNIEYDYLEGK